MTQLSTFGRILLENVHGSSYTHTEDTLLASYQLHQDLTGFQSLSPDELIDAAKLGKNRIPIIMPGPKAETRPETFKKPKPVVSTTSQIIAKLNSEYPNKLYTRM